MRWVLLTSVVLALAAVPAEAHLRTAGAWSGVTRTPVQLVSEADATGSASGLAVVGRHNIGGRGFNADVWVHERYAYVGSWGFSDWNTAASSGSASTTPRTGWR